MQSGFFATRERPQTHFPPSPKAPRRSTSCGQLNAGVKKSPNTCQLQKWRRNKRYTTYTRCKQAKVGRWEENCHKLSENGPS